MYLERLQEFLPSILVITAIGLSATIAYRIIGKRMDFRSKDVAWFKANQWKLAGLGSLAEYVMAPTLEEVLFRAPLLIAFSSVSAPAWIWIIVTGVLFSLMHLMNPVRLQPSQVIKKDNGEERTGNLVETVEELSKEKKDQLKVQRIIQLTLTLVMGIVQGYFAIVKQSLWIAVAIHAAVNMFMPVILVLVIAILAVLYFVLCWIWNQIREGVLDAYDTSINQRRNEKKYADYARESMMRRAERDYPILKK